MDCGVLVTLWQSNIALENGLIADDSIYLTYLTYLYNIFNIAIFHSYVGVPEGMLVNGGT